MSEERDGSYWRDFIVEKGNLAQHHTILTYTIIYIFCKLSAVLGFCEQLQSSSHHWIILRFNILQMMHFVDAASLTRLRL